MLGKGLALNNGANCAHKYTSFRCTKRAVNWLAIDYLHSLEHNKKKKIKSVSICVHLFGWYIVFEMEKLKTLQRLFSFKCTFWHNHKFLACSPLSWFLDWSLADQMAKLAWQPSSKGFNAEENRLMSSYNVRHGLSKNWICTSWRAQLRSNMGWGSMFNSRRSISPWCQNSSAISWLTCLWTSQGLVAFPRSAAVIRPAWRSSRFCVFWRNDSFSSSWAPNDNFDRAGASRKCSARSVARMLLSMTAKVSAYSSYKSRYIKISFVNTCLWATFLSTFMTKWQKKPWPNQSKVPTFFKLSRILFPRSVRRRRHWFKWCLSKVDVLYNLAKGLFIFCWKELLVPLWSRSWLMQATMSPRISVWK